MVLLFILFYLLVAALTGYFVFQLLCAWENKARSNSVEEVALIAVVASAAFWILFIPGFLIYKLIGRRLFGFLDRLAVRAAGLPA
jgi:uncharacterized membrane protein